MAAHAIDLWRWPQRNSDPRTHHDGSRLAVDIMPPTTRQAEDAASIDLHSHKRLWHRLLSRCAWFVRGCAAFVQHATTGLMNKLGCGNIERFCPGEYHYDTGIIILMRCRPHLRSVDEGWTAHDGTNMCFQPLLKT